MRSRVLIFTLIVLAPLQSWGRDPLQNKDHGEAGRPSAGLGQLLSDLPEDHPVQREFKQMLNEIKAGGGSVQIKDFGAFTFANHIPVSPGITVFRYNPSRLRAVDALEEIVHWKQIKEGGAYWRDYSNHPLYQKYQNKAVIMEDMAKKSLLNRTDLTPVLREELRQDLARVQKNEYTYDLSGNNGDKCDVITKLNRSK